MSLRSYLQLVRLPNVFTAVTNVFTGYAAASWPRVDGGEVALLAFGSACLYAGGVALNDYCDRDVDRLERPHRPLPSGQIAAAAALSIAAFLLILGCALAAGVSRLAGWTAAALVIAVAAYDARLKKFAIVGPLTMGACRFGNVLLGASAAAGVAPALPFATAMMAWVVAISFISRREAGKPAMQTIVKFMVLAIPVLDGIFVGWLTTPLLGLAVAVFALPAWLIARRLYVT
jgi:4-hydroxybenzoate polyprenyltransferase